MAQNHRLSEVRRDHFEIICSNLLLDCAQLLVQDCIQQDFDISINRLHKLSKQSVPVLNHSLNSLKKKKKGVFLLFRWNFTCFNLCPLPPLLIGHY